MFVKKRSLPVEDEIVMCTVTKIYGHAVFVHLDEYDRSGMIHISEISPGRIRNIRDYVVEDKKILCKVLRIDREKGHIDLSLRRVSESQKRDKSNEIKRQQISEKIIEQVAKQNKIDPQGLYNILEEKTRAEYPTIAEYFDDVSTGVANVSSTGLQLQIANALTELIKQRIKPPVLEISGEIKIVSYDPNGVELIKNALIAGEKAVDKEVKVFYLGAGKFKMSVQSLDYKDAEKILNKAVEAVNASIPKGKAEVEFVRTDKK